MRAGDTGWRENPTAKSRLESFFGYYSFTIRFRCPGVELAQNQVDISTTTQSMMLTEVRHILCFEEAVNSPALLSDLAGLENYIAESYNARSFVELMQNADDAGATRIVIPTIRESLLVANDGREFTQTDFESLCRSAASSKLRGPSIGFRGIGFKSVVGFAKAIHLFSGELEATFSRDLTARAIPLATRVPLVRIPHPIETGIAGKICRRIGANEIRRIQDGVGILMMLLPVELKQNLAAFDPSSPFFCGTFGRWSLKLRLKPS